MEKIKEGRRKTEIGLIPDSWKVKEIGELCDFIVPGRNKPKDFKGDIPWITTPDIDGIKVSTSRAELFISKEEAKSVGSKIVPKDSIIMSCVGDLGLVAIAEKNIVINQQLHAFLPSGKTIQLYLLYALSMQKKQMENKATKTAVPYLNKDNCNSIQIPLPPTLEEQKAIATALSDVDALIQSLDKLIAKKKAIKQGTMQRLLKSPAEGGQRLPGFSGEWEVKRLGDILDVDPENLSSSTNEDYSFDYISLEDVERGSLKGMTKMNFKDSPSRARRVVRKEDILFGTVRPNLKSHYLFLKEKDDIVCSTGFCVLRSVSKKVKTTYVYYHLFGYDIKNQINAILVGSSYPAVNSKDVKNLTISIPINVKEQQAIAQILSDMDQEIEILAQKREKYRSIKQGMMQELLTGKKRLL